MSSIQLENTFAEDERWLEAGANAFALHIAACCYSDRLNKDGTVPKAMVPRIALAVLPADIPAAVAGLLDAGFWEDGGTEYLIVGYLEDKIGLSAEEKDANRARWAKDKARQRRHSMGNHDLCTPRMCPIARQMSTVDSTRESTRVSSTTTRPDTTRLDPTRPDSGEARESGRESGDAEAAPAPAAAGPGRPAPEEEGAAPSRTCALCLEPLSLTAPGHWECLDCPGQPAPKRRGILHTPEPGTTYRSKREQDREQELAQRAADEAERERVTQIFQGREAAS